MKRNAGYCLLQLIVPAAAVVASSWVALWLQEETEFGDLIAVILAIILLSYSQNSTMPRVSYLKVIDIYLGACFIFTFFSLAKLVLLKYVGKRCREQNRDENSFEDYLLQMKLASMKSLFGGRKKRRIGHAGKLPDIKVEDEIEAGKEDLEEQGTNAVQAASSEEKKKPGVVFRVVMACHILTQLLLPILFGGFIVAVLLVIPNVDRGSKCW